MNYTSVIKRASLFYAIVLALAVILSHFAFSRYEASFRDQHNALAAHSVNAVNGELRLLLNDIPRASGLFAKHNSELLWNLSRNPGDEALYDRINRSLTEYFPEHSAFTIADNNGKLLYGDLGNNLGAQCLENIQQSAKIDRPVRIVVHPGPAEHHFDVTVPWFYQGVKQGVFFTSYRLREIARLLEVGQADRHRLILTNNDDPTLIEVTASGSRDALQEAGSIRLTESDISRIAYSKWVEGTNWVLRDLYDERLIPDYRLRLWRPLIGAWIVVLFLTGMSFYFIRKAGLASLV